jgi:nucleotide-binding universal stress UspA family protein
MEIRTILVPTDFSTHANAALEYAMELAATFGARLHLLHAYHVDIPVAGPGGIALPANFYDEFRKAAKANLDELLQRVKERGIQADGEVVPAPPAIAILDSAEQLPADLVVMGTRGRTGLAHVLLGSVAERTVRMAPCPVLTLRVED